MQIILRIIKFSFAAFLFNFFLLIKAAIPAEPQPILSHRAFIFPKQLFFRLTSNADATLTVTDRERLRRAFLNKIPKGQQTWDSECEYAYKNTFIENAAGLNRIFLTKKSWLIQIQCAQGAYQGSSWIAHLWRDSAGLHAAVLQWQIPDMGEQPNSASTPVKISKQIIVWGEVTSLEFKATRNPKVEILNRFRAIGDCGVRARYSLAGERTKLLQLAGILTCPETLSSTSNSPDNWPVLKTLSH